MPEAEAGRIPTATGGTRWQKTTLGYYVHKDLYVPRTPEEVAAYISPAAASGLEEGRRYGLWVWNQRRQKERPERGDDGEIRQRFEVTYRPKEQWSVIPVDLTDSGLSPEVVAAARERVSQNERRPPSRAARRFWQLSGGIVRCGVCGSVLSPHAAPQRTTGYRYYYRCRQRYGNGARDCTNTRSMRAEPLEETVWRVVHG